MGCESARKGVSVVVVVTSRNNSDTSKRGGLLKESERARERRGKAFFFAVNMRKKSLWQEMMKEEWNESSKHTHTRKQASK